MTSSTIRQISSAACFFIKRHPLNGSHCKLFSKIETTRIVHTGSHAGPVWSKTVGTKRQMNAFIMAQVFHSLAVDALIARDSDLLNTTILTEIRYWRVRSTGRGVLRRAC